MDDLRFKPVKYSVSESLTKRKLLRNIAPIYDLLHWLAPMMIGMEILMQKCRRFGTLKLAEMTFLLMKPNFRSWKLFGYRSGFIIHRNNDADFMVFVMPRKQPMR